MSQGLTCIKYCTDGVLLREMMEDPLLSTYRCNAATACGSNRRCSDPNMTVVPHVVQRCHGG